MGIGSGLGRSVGCAVMRVYLYIVHVVHVSVARGQCEGWQNRASGHRTVPLAYDTQLNSRRERILQKVPFGGPGPWSRLMVPRLALRRYLQKPRFPCLMGCQISVLTMTTLVPCYLKLEPNAATATRHVGCALSLLLCSFPADCTGFTLSHVWGVREKKIMFCVV